MAVSIDRIAYCGWPECYRIANDCWELVVTASIGPRVMYCGFRGGQNLFKHYAEELGGMGEPDWKIRGGHRVWVAPEKAAITYEIDNAPVEIRIHGDVLTAISPTDPRTRLQKSITIAMDATRAEADVSMRIRNHNLFAMSYGAWGPSVMAQGGLGITGFPPRGTHEANLEPVNPLIMWAYTDFSDPRWRFTSKYVTLRQDPHAESPQKLGHFNVNTFGAYLLNEELFLKRTFANPAKPYPDMGCSYQTFTNADMLELETVGALETVRPGGFAELRETWSLHSGIQLREISDAELDRILLPLLGGI